MKSAFELAMERFGGDVQTFSDEQKEELAEVDKVYDAKAAQAKFDAQARLERAEDREKADQIREDLTVELASVERRREQKKEELRQKFSEES